MDLLIPYVVFGFTFLLEFALFLLLPNRTKPARYVASINICFLVFVSTSFVFVQLSLFTALFAFINLFRAVNSARVVANRMHPKALSRRFRLSALWLETMAIFAALLVYADADWNMPEALVVLSLIGSAFMFINTIVSFNRWSKNHPTVITSKKLPTVSLCVPARNETQDLPDCIESMLNSTYPKLEILVLDDCSHDKTPELIRQYAHKGVRFVSGEEPDTDWLAKNKAMNKLFDESTGDIVIYMGVDVRIRPDTVQEIVQQFNNGLDMISILPLRDEAQESSVFIQPLRYWWELAVPRFLGGRPPVLSTCWAIRRKILRNIGDFESVKRSVQPEAHFAKKLKETYKFVISGSRMGVTTVKKPREQYDTALRTRYPQARWCPEKVLLLLLSELIIFLTPLAGIVIGLNNGNTFLLVISIISTTLLITINVLISKLVVSKTWIFGLFTVPFLLVEEWYLLIKSMLAYEFGVVIWKDRNICLPMLQVEKNYQRYKSA